MFNLYSIRIVDFSTQSHIKNVHPEASPGCRVAVASDHAQRWGFLGVQDGPWEPMEPENVP